MKVERVMGIEPNEHRTPCFLGKYRYHTDHSENPRDPILPMFSLCLSDVGVGDSSIW